MNDNVYAEVILRSRDGSSVLDADEPIRSENVASHAVETEVIEEASDALRELGFEITQTSEVGLTISGPKERFEEVFETTLEERSATAATHPGQQPSYEATDPIQIPDELSPYVADIAFPTPPEFH